VLPPVDPAPLAEQLPPTARIDCTFNVCVEPDVPIVLEFRPLLVAEPLVVPAEEVLDPAPAPLALPPAALLDPAPPADELPEPDMLALPLMESEATVISTRLPTLLERFTPEALGDATTMYICDPVPPLALLALLLPLPLAPLAVDDSM